MDPVVNPRADKFLCYRRVSPFPKRWRERDPDDALRLCRRMQALSDVDAQAVRLKRIIAACKADPALSAASRSADEVDELLYICDIMANGPVYK